MADRVEWFDVTVAAGTAKSAAVESNLSFPQGEAVQIEITIPDGHAGLTGIAIMQAHTRIIPMTDAAFIVGNDRTIVWPLHNYLNNGNWSALVYNADTFAHTFHIAFLVNELGAETAILQGGISPLVVVGGIPQVYAGSTGTATDIRLLEE